jgi:hypothetical protein
MDNTMNGYSFIAPIESIIGSLALFVLVMVALGTIVGMLKPAQAVKNVGVIVGIAIVAVLLVSVLVGLWSTMSVWQRVILAGIIFAVWRMRRGHKLLRKSRDDE